MHEFFLHRMIIYAGFLLLLLCPFHSVSADDSDSILFTVTAAIAGGSNSKPPPPPPPPQTLTLRIYVAGESVEEQNHFDFPPYNANGTLNHRGTDNNTTGEFGWMVPFAERLKLRDPNLSPVWVGSGCWIDHDYNCSSGVYTNHNIGKTSAVSGSTVADWLSSYGSELTSREHCYDIAFASRGGNDLNNGVARETYKQQLRQLILLLDQGSKCRTHPVIYVTAHILDVAGWSYNPFPADITAWMAAQNNYYVNVAKELVSELNNTNGRIVRFVDMWTPFREEWQTTAFPNETWWAKDPDTNADMPNLDKIHHDGEQHPRRLASIFAGENAADQINIGELKNLLGRQQ